MDNISALYQGLTIKPASEWSASTTTPTTTTSTTTTTTKEGRRSVTVAYAALPDHWRSWPISAAEEEAILSGMGPL